MNTTINPLDTTLRDYTVDTLKLKDRFTVKTNNINDAYRLGRLQCYIENKKFIRIIPVRLKMLNTI